MPGTGYGRSGEAKIDAVFKGIVLYPLGIIQSLIARLVGYEQFMVRMV